MGSSRSAFTSPLIPPLIEAALDIMFSRATHLCRLPPATPVDWLSLAEALARLGPGIEVKVSKDEAPHPSSVEGFHRSLGHPRGQLADYRLELSGGGCLHVVEFQDHYLAHVDAVDPSRDPLGHLLRDAPGWATPLIVASAPLAAFIGLGRALRAAASFMAGGLRALVEAWGRSCSRPSTSRPR